jgi:hypothetical protein
MGSGLAAADDHDAHGDSISIERRHLSKSSPPCKDKPAMSLGVPGYPIISDSIIDLLYL